MSIMILSESTISMLIPWFSSFVLEVKKLLKTKVILEYLILRLIFFKLFFKGCFLMRPFILHSQKSRHGRALWNLWLVHWLIIPVMRHARAFSKMKYLRRFFDSVQSHIFYLSSKILHDSQKDLRKVLSFFITSKFRGFTLVSIIICVIKYLLSSFEIPLLSVSKRLFFFLRHIGFLQAVPRWLLWYHCNIP